MRFQLISLLCASTPTLFTTAPALAGPRDGIPAAQVAGCGQVAVDKAKHAGWAMETRDCEKPKQQTSAATKG
jgi:hypothetical protein